MRPLSCPLHTCISPLALYLSSSVIVKTLQVHEPFLLDQLSVSWLFYLITQSYYVYWSGFLKKNIDSNLCLFIILFEHAYKFQVSYADLDRICRLNKTWATPQKYVHRDRSLDTEEECILIFERWHLCRSLIRGLLPALPDLPRLFVMNPQESLIDIRKSKFNVLTCQEAKNWVRARCIRVSLT